MCLPDASGAGQREQSHLWTQQQIPCCVELLLAPDQWGERYRDITEAPVLSLQGQTAFQRRSCRKGQKLGGRRDGRGDLAGLGQSGSKAEHVHEALRGLLGQAFEHHLLDG